MEIKQGELFLSSVTMKNYRAFEELTVDFDERLTVIVGSNGSGKTTILDAAAAALSAYLFGFDGLGLYSIQTDDARVKCIKLGDMTDVQGQYPVEISATADVFCPQVPKGTTLMNTPMKELSSQEVTWKRIRNSASSHARQNVKEILPMQKVGEFYQACIRAGGAFNASIITAPILAYYSTRRLWENKEPKKMLDATFSRQDAYKDCLDAHLDISALKTWFERMTYKGLQAGKMSAAFSVVKRAMELAFRSISASSEARVDMNLDTREIEIEYLDKNSKWNKLTLNQMSDGYKGIICLIADIAYRMAVLNPQLEDKALEETGGVVLIDEVDLHLHPAWQQRVLGDLQSIFPKVQFIVTTHAPAVINTVERSHIRMMNNGTVSYAPTETYGKDANGVLNTIMGADERPASVKDKFGAFYDAMAADQYTRAEAILSELSEILGENDPDLAACQMKLALAQI